MQSVGNLQSYLNPWQSLSRTDVALFYGNDANHDTQFRAISCAVTQDHIQLTCQISPGVGTDFKFVVVVGGQRSDRSTQVLSYAKPSLTKCFGRGSFNADTSGGEQVFFRGLQLGPKMMGRKRTGCIRATTTTSQRFAASGAGLCRCSPPSWWAFWCSA